MPNSGKVGEPYKQIVDSMDDVAFVVNEDMTIRFANQAALNYANSSLEEIQGTPIEPITKRMAAEEEDPERFIKAVTAILSGEEPEVGTYVQGPMGTETFSLEFELSFRDTGHVVAEQRIKPIEFEDGSRGLCVISRDITSRKEKLREREQFKEAVENAGHAIYFTDTNGTIEYVNPAFEESSGYSAEEVLGTNPRILKSGEHDEEFFENLWNTILDGETWESEVINQRKSGERYAIDQTIAPITDENDNLKGFVAVNIDITERKHRKQVIEVLNRVLRHNMRNALSVTMGRAEVIIQDRVETLGSIRREVREIAEELSQSSGISGDTSRVDIRADQLIETISGLNSVADKIRTDAKKIEESAEDLQELSEKTTQVQDMVQQGRQQSNLLDLSSLFADEQAELRERYPEAEFSIEVPNSVSIPLDTHIQPAIRELLENAVQHNDKSTSSVDVTVSRPQGKMVEITVSDNGPGIPEEERQVLERGEETPLLHGSGIGLWMVYWAITIAGGDLSIDDNEPRGSVVTFTLPTGSDRIEVNRTDENEDF